LPFTQNSPFARLVPAPSGLPAGTLPSLPLYAEGAATRRPTGPLIVTLPSGQKALAVDTDAPVEAPLVNAEAEALQFGHGWVGTEHLLLATTGAAGGR
jgi:hypothetical protein